MSVTEIKDEIRSLSTEEQDHLSAFLVALRHERDLELRSELQRQVLNEDPEEWITLAEVKRRLQDVE